MAATVLPRGRGAAVGVGIFAVSLGVASSVVAVIARDVAFIPGCQGACSGLGFTGVLPNENLLGIALVASIPFTYLGFRGRSRTFFILYLAGMARHSSYDRNTALLAAAGIIDTQAVSFVAKTAIGRLKPSDIATGGNYREERSLDDSGREAHPARAAQREPRCHSM